VEERKISVEEIKKSLLSGALTEAFGVGTAATVAPIVTIGMNDTLYEISQGKGKSIGSRIKNTLDGIRYARSPDIFRWNYYLSDKESV
jgi:branched-chain amino acid aminotransferase